MRLLILAILSVQLSGQTIVRKVFSGITVATTSGSILNQGQTTHTLYVQNLNSGGTCNVNTGFIQIQASYDGTTYFGITAAPLILSPISNGYNGTISVSAGPFPYLQVSQYSNPGTNCATSAWYSGSTFSVSQPQMLQSIAGQWRNFLQTGNTADIAIAGGGGIKRAVLYALEVSNLNTTNPLVITITENTFASNCSGGLITSYAGFNINAGQSIVIPASIVPFATASQTNTLLCAHFAGTSINYSLTDVNRQEQ